MDDRWLSVEDIAEYLAMSGDTVYTWLSTPGLPRYRMGLLSKFNRNEVDEWVRAGRAEERPDSGSSRTGRFRGARQ